MRDLARKLEDARTQVQPAWSDDRARSVERSMRRRRTRRATTQIVLAAAACSLLVAGLGAGWMQSRSQGSSLTASPSLAGLAPQALQLDDGSTARPLDHATAVRSIESSAGRVVMDLPHGRASFDVTPNPSREFHVHAGSVDVKVLGTQFVVAHVENEVTVTVLRGHVRVSWPDGSRELLAGQGGTFPPPAEVVAPSNSQTRDDAKQPSSALSAPKQAMAAAPDWRLLAAQGEFSEAWSIMQATGKSAVRDDAADLLLAADVARMSRHSSEAVEPLRRLLASHGSDPRASLAAFTLGRVLLDELGRPGEGALAFAQARSLAPAGSMAQDALAREVEALSKAGDTVRARQRAEEYLQAYPNGRRSKSVRRYGGLE